MTVLQLIVEPKRTNSRKRKRTEDLESDMRQKAKKSSISANSPERSTEATNIIKN